MGIDNIKSLISMPSCYFKLSRVLKKHYSTTNRVDIDHSFYDYHLMTLISAATVYAKKHNKVLVFTDQDIRASYLEMYGDLAADTTLISYCRNRENTDYLVLPYLPKDAKEVCEVLTHNKSNNYYILK